MQHIIQFTPAITAFIHKIDTKFMPKMRSIQGKNTSSTVLHRTRAVFFQSMRTAVLGFIGLFSLYVQAIELKVAMPDQRPMVIYENGQLVGGIDYELMELIARRTGWKVSYHACAWQDCIAALQTGELDLIGHALLTEDRTQFMRYIQPPYIPATSPVAFYHLADKTHKVIRYEDLYRYQIAVIANAKYFPKFDSDLLLKKKAYINEHESFKALQSGEVDLVAGTNSIMLRTIQQLSLQKKVLPTSYRYLQNRHAYFAFSRRSPVAGHFAALEAEFRKLWQDDTMESILEKYDFAVPANVILANDHKEPVTLVTYNNPPFAFIQNGEMQGIHIDKVKTVIEQSGHHYNLGVMDRHRAIKLLEKRKNFAIFPLAKLKGITNKAIWVGPLATETWIIVTRKNASKPITTLNDASQLESIATAYKDDRSQFLLRMGFRNLKYAASAEEAFFQLINGQVEAWATSIEQMDVITGKYASGTKDRLNIALRFRESPLYIAFSRLTDEAVIAEWQKTFPQDNDTRDDGQNEEK